MIYLLLALLLLALLWFFSHYTLWRPLISPRHPRILMYHSISEQPTDLAVSPARLARQLAWLNRQGYQFVFVSELIGQPPRDNQVALTFDDGFADNYHNLLPLLERFNAKATIYLAPQISAIERLSPAQIRIMQFSGRCEFGAHTLDHVNLSHLDEAQARHQINASKQAVEQLSGVPCRSFAYPFGRFNEQTVELVRQAGFSSAVTVKKGIAPITDPLRIKRISILGKTNQWQFMIAMQRGRYRV